jgi:hypothetical protein
MVIISGHKWSSKRYSLPRNHFIGNKFCSPDNSAMQLIHILTFCALNNVFQKPPRRKDPEESNLENEGSEMSPSLSVYWSGNFLYRKARTRQEKWRIEPPNWNTVLFGGPCYRQTLLLSFKRLPQRIKHQQIGAVCFGYTRLNLGRTRP